LNWKLAWYFIIAGTDNQSSQGEPQKSVTDFVLVISSPLKKGELKDLVDPEVGS
jgi:hypothetical protein